MGLPPRIVAEALEDVADARATALHAGPSAPVTLVARGIAAALLPPEARVQPPDWLWASLATPFRRAVHALERHGGALIALPVGSGKTWLALALALRSNDEASTSVLVPAPLRGHWIRTAGSVGATVEVVSHARASRGGLKPGRGLVIIDESHHFRNRLTRRYALVAPWLLGRPGVLLSATPVVNRLDDLAAQLRLVVRDDALATSGIGSLSTLLASGEGHPALSDLVIS